MSTPVSSNINRVVIRSTNWVGDCVMTVPALRAVRRILPNAHITLALRPGVSGLFADADFVDDILTYDRKNVFSVVSQILDADFGDGILTYDRKNVFSVVSQIREWRKRSFDLAILFQNAFEAAVIPYIAGVPMRLGYATEGRQAMLTHPVGLPEWRSTKHEVFYYLYLVAALEQELFGTNTICDGDPDTSLSISEPKKVRATELLSSEGFANGNSLVVICPGSINSRAKRWPAERFAALSDRLIEENRTVVLIGSKDELEVTQQVTKRMTRQPIVLTGKTNLDEVTSILSLADLVITNDTGPAHIAAALQRPTLVIFGPTNPLTTRPFSMKSEILRHPPDCAPCMLRDCPIDHRCMTAISVDEVFEQSHAILKRSSFARTVKSLCDSVA